MRTPAQCKSSSFKKRLSLAIVAASSVLAGSSVMAEGFSAYGGASVGLAPSSQSCSGEPCDRLSGGSKVFAGWNMTPNVAAEINFFYFGKVKSTTYTPGTSGNPGTTIDTSRDAEAVTLGINWKIEMLRQLTNHVRLGIARTRHTTYVTNSVTPFGTPIYGPEVKSEETTTRPYIGLGLSIPFNSYLRFQTGYDFIWENKQSMNHHLLSAGIFGEF